MMPLRERVPLFLLTLVLAIALFRVGPVSSQDLAKLSIFPRISYAPIDDSFLINITISDALYVYAWGLNMTFNQNVLEFVNVTLGDFLERQPEGSSLAGKRVNQTEGWVYIVGSTIGAHEGQSGSGVLATIEFRVLSEGESIIGYSLARNRTELLSQDSPIFPPQLEPISFTAEDGFFTNEVTPPVADFEYYPIVFDVDEDVTFDASASTATSPMEIVEYSWDFGDGTNATVTTPTVNHSFAESGIFKIRLTVFDNATASPLAKSEFSDDTRVQMDLMPNIWYELYSTKEVTIGLAFPHDIAIRDVQLSSTEVTAGTTVSIEVTVLNRGTEQEENFTLAVYYDTNMIESKQESLLSGEEKVVTFNWDTTDVPEGDYLIKAEASGVEGEGNPNDNRFFDGTVTIKAGSEPFPTTLIVIGGAAGIGIVLVVILLYMRRRSAPST